MSPITRRAQPRSTASRRQPIRTRLLFGTAVLQLVLAACAPDAWKAPTPITTPF